MRSYGLEPPSEGLSELDLLALGPGPIAEGKVEPSAKSNSSVKSIKASRAAAPGALGR
jgi:hypothetical protein